jgi:predicted metal-dependent hydrolase
VASDSHLIDFIACFNRQAYYEAHDVLEELWLKTSGENRDFYKGLIQTAAVLLKLQQGKPDPAARLAQRAASHLEKHRPMCECVNVDEVLGWLQDVVRGRNILAEGAPPRLELLDQ